VRIQMMSIRDLKRNPRNARTHPKKQVVQIAASINAFGFVNPVLVTKDGDIIAGHGRVEAACLEGMSEIPVIVLKGLSRTKRRALAIADNKIAANAGWNYETLAIEIPELAQCLPKENLDLTVLGFDPVEIDQLQTNFEDDSRDPEDEIESAWSEGRRSARPVTDGSSVTTVSIKVMLA